MSCDFLTDLPAWLMLVGWFLLPATIVGLTLSLRLTRSARSLLEQANDRLIVAETLHSLIPYAPGEEDFNGEAP